MRLIFIFMLTAVPLAASCNSTHPVLPDSDPQKAEFTLFREAGQDSVLEDWYSVLIDDPASLLALKKVILAAVNVPIHKCASVGSIKISFVDGSVAWLNVLPGHEPDAYEIQDEEGLHFRVDRSDFFSALSSGGVDVKRLPG